VELAVVRRVEMSRFIGLACVCMLLFPVIRPQGGDRFSKYQPVEAYEIRPGILMMPRYSSDRQVCEVEIEKRHYSNGTVYLDSTLPRDTIIQIIEELVPLGERGPREKDFETDLILHTGPGMTTSSEYENVSIQIYSEVLPASRKGNTVRGDIIALVHWKNRNCQ